MHATKKKLLESATRRFARVGYEETNVPAIARGAGVAVGTVYRHFASKEELLQQVVEQSIGSFREVVFSALAGNLADKVLQEVFRQIWADFVAFAAEYPDAYRLATSAEIRGKLTQDGLAQAHARLFDPLRQLIEHGNQFCGLDVPDVQMAAELVRHCFHSITTVEGGLSDPVRIDWIGHMAWSLLVRTPSLEKTGQRRVSLKRKDDWRVW